MDFVSDQNPRPLYRVDALVGTPDWVASAPVITKDSLVKMAHVAFADPATREFPCFDKVSTYLSYAYLRGASCENPKVESKLRKAAQAFGISAEFEKIDTALNSVKQASAPTPNFALPAGSVKDMNFNLYPINSREEIEHSAHQLLNDRSRMPVGAYYKAATACVKAAAAHPGTQLPQRIAIAGEERFPDFEYATKIASNRRFVVKDPEVLALYADLVKAAESTSEVSPEDFAQLWVELDTTAGVKYANGIVDPYAAVFSGPTKAEVEKAAGEFAFVAEAPVPVSTLRSISEESLRQRFAKTTADNVIEWRKMAAADITTKVAALERSVQRELLRLALAVS